MRHLEKIVWNGQAALWYIDDNYGSDEKQSRAEEGMNKKRCPACRSGRRKS